MRALFASRRCSDSAHKATIFRTTAVNTTGKLTFDFFPSPQSFVLGCDRIHFRRVPAQSPSPYSIWLQIRCLIL